MEINFIPEKNLNNHVKGISTEALEMVIEYTKKKYVKYIVIKKEMEQDFFVLFQ